jgi:hypothetical protein
VEDVSIETLIADVVANPGLQRVSCSVPTVAIANPNQAASAAAGTAAFAGRRRRWVRRLAAIVRRIAASVLGRRRRVPG